MNWKNYFNGKTLRRARGLSDSGHVLTVSSDGRGGLDATVLGSSNMQYEVSITLEEGGVWSDCDCPVGYHCKHAAAVMYAMEKDGYNVADYLYIAFADEDRDEAEFVPDLPVAVPEYAEWVAGLRQAAQEKPAATDEQSAADEGFLVYVLRPAHSIYRNQADAELEPYQVKHLKKGGWSAPAKTPVDLGLLLSKPYVSKEDRLLLVELHPHKQLNDRLFLIRTADSVEMIERLLETGRLCWGEAREDCLLKAEEPVKAEPGWELQDDGTQRPVLRLAGAATVLAADHPFCVNEKTMTFSRLRTSVSPGQAAAWARGKNVQPEHLESVAALLRENTETAVMPEPSVPETVSVDCGPVPVLRFRSGRPTDGDVNYFYAGAAEELHGAEVRFDYQGARFAVDEARSFARHDGKLMEVNRRTGEERQWFAQLEVVGLQPLGHCVYWLERSSPKARWLGFKDRKAWMNFMVSGLPDLVEEGWKIEYDDSFGLRLKEPERWHVGAVESETGNHWFEAQVDIEVDGERVRLLPLLLKWLRQASPYTIGRELEKPLIAEIGPDRNVLLPPERIRPLVSTLLELFDSGNRTEDDGLRISALRAMELARFDETEWGGEFPEQLKENAVALRNITSVPQVPAPSALQAELRGYQQEGLAWMQFLRELGFGAVLADDMGLGKTVQALSHILIEKESGRMQSPCLIVAPTSVLYNWRAEAAKFAPSLKVHVWHGPQRMDQADELQHADLIITSYPLLARDTKELLALTYHLAVLDEAQFIRNPKTIAARTAFKLKAGQRIGLTGTPLENNLDELWSLFNFVMPGLLGAQPLFNKLFRTPIEKGHSQIARRVLASRIAPFMLRRTKNQVVLELPPKTETIQRIELTGRQADLYETVRTAMEHKVRDAMQEKGLARSHIIVLDALLKLRQVCCHPQLLKLEAAKKVKDSAKLEALREMLAEMVPEGRRILIFSQFTSMLTHIEKMLQQKKIDFVKITGSTKDRRTPVERFQNGEVPVFLISLKAGGTGLNLTAADTVIHYDPWWNPAVEAQATDRAHRIGQQQPVFVYKLIAAGTVEEKIVELQDRKRELIDGLLEDREEALSRWSEEDIENLFSPLEEPA